MQAILGAGEVAERLHHAAPALVVAACAAAVTRVAGALSLYADKRITPPLTTKADTDLVAAVCGVEVAALSEPGFSDRQESAEVGVVRSYVMVNDAQTMVSSLVQMVTACGVLSVLHPLMLALMLLTVISTGVGALLTARVDYTIHYANISDRNVRSMMRWWATTPKYADEVRANGMRSYLLFWYRSLSQRMDRRTVAAAPRVLRIQLVSALIAGVVLAGTWAALAWLALTGRVDLAVAATVVLAMRTTLAALRQVVISGAAMFHTSLYLTDMQTFLDDAAARAPQRTPQHAGHHVPVPAADPSRPLAVRPPVTDIRLDEVVYQYPGKDRPAVDGVSLTLHRGEILAIVGENGSGKSTLTRLITGIHLAQKGRVEWNGTDLAAVDPDTVWACTGLVPQVFAQWPLRVRENVTLGQPRSHDDGPVWDALDDVGLRETVAELPERLDSLLSREWYGGVELSGGQWQRIACSRALYRKPPLLILDEPTSQMDPRGEHDIFEKIKAIAADRITIVVTHRLENTRIADRIIVMEHGRITESGRYDDLVNGGGLFAELLALSQRR